MPAPTHVDLYKPKKSFEAALKAYLAAAPRSIANLYTAREPVDLITPRVEIIFNLSQEQQQRRRVGTKLVPCSWAYGCKVRVVTSRVGENDAGGKDHDDLVGEVICYLQAYGSPFNATNMPYWQVMSFMFLGSAEGPVATNEEDATDLEFGGVIGILESAWPVTPVDTPTLLQI